MRFDWRGLSTGRQVLLAAGLLLFIDLFLDWQQVCASFGPAGSVCGSRSGWHGIGILVGLLTIALLAWEAIGALNVDLGDAVRALPANLISAALAAAVKIGGSPGRTPACGCPPPAPPPRTGPSCRASRWSCCSGAAPRRPIRITSIAAEKAAIGSDRSRTAGSVSM